MADPVLVAECIVDVVPSVMRLLRKNLREAAHGELTVPQLRILAHIHKGTDTAAELAELQGVSVAAICKMVELLAERRLVARAYRDGNRKQIHLALTAEGERLFARVRRAASKRFAEALKKVSLAEREEMRRGLGALKMLCETERD